jgi:hypothetical protein
LAGAFDEWQHHDATPHSQGEKKQRPMMWSTFRLALNYFHIQSYQVNPEDPHSAARAAAAIHTSRDWRAGRENHGRTNNQPTKVYQFHGKLHHLKLMDSGYDDEHVVSAWFYHGWALPSNSGI